MFNLKQKKGENFKNDLENKEASRIEQEEKMRVIAREKAENELKEEKKKKDMKTGAIGCIIFAVIIILIIIFSSGGEEKTPINWTEQNNSTMAYIKAENFVKQNLKSPSSADFPGILERENHVIKGDNNTYIINSYVDSQNSFGAKIRTYFTLTIQQTDKDNWKLIDINFIEN